MSSEFELLDTEISKFSKKELVETIINPDFDEHAANIIKIKMIEQYAREIDKIAVIPSGASVPEAISAPINNFSNEDLMYISYIYYTSVGKEATDARKEFRKRLIMKVALTKWDERSFILEADGGLSYSRWCTIWVKETEKNFAVHFGKDISKWLPKIIKKFEDDRYRAEVDGLI